VTGEGRLVLRPSEGGFSSTLDFTPKHQIDETGLPQTERGQTPGDTAQTVVFSDEPRKSCTKIGENTMRGKQRNVNQQHQFAVAMALGEKVSVWAKKNGVPGG
jgi:hypothetical protein